MSLVAAGRAGAERWELVLSVDKLIASLARKARLPGVDRQDVEGDLRLLAFDCAGSWDEARGVKFGTYVTSAAGRWFAGKRAELMGRPLLQAHDDALRRVPDHRGGQAEPDTEGELHQAVRAQLVGAAVDGLPRSYAEVVRLVGQEGATVEGAATRLGRTVKHTRLTAKLAIRELARKGVVEPAAAAIASAPRDAAANGKRRAAAAERAARKRAAEEVLRREAAGLRAAGMTQQQIADRLGVGTSTVSRLLRADDRKE